MKEIEILEKRKEREKHFLQEDGNIIARVYNDDVHFFKDGQYHEIDNTLTKKGNYYNNKNNAYKVYFKENSEENLMKLETANHYINIELKNSKNIDIKTDENILYEDIIDGIDLQYKVMPTKVKENIIIKRRESILNKLTFLVDTDLQLVQNKNKSISALKDDKTIFMIDSPYMIDSNQEINNNVYYKLNKINDKYEIDLILDYDWLKSIDTVYPVNIDPTISNHSQDNNVYDTYIYPGDTNVNRNSQDKLKAGTEVIGGVNVINRTLLKFVLPTIGTESQIVAASAILAGYPTLLNLSIPYTEKIMSVHELTSDWDEVTANWENMNDKYNPKKETVFRSLRSYYEVQGGAVNVVNNYIDLTSIVKKWYIDKPNYGVMIKSYDESKIEDTLPEFFSKNNSATGYNPKPFLEVIYRNQNGLLSYLDYSSQNFTEGKAYVNNYNGNLTTVFDTGSTIKGKLPASLKLVYNTNDVILNNNIGYGLGYNISLQQTIKELTIDNIVYLEYKDEDGTKQYFVEQSGIFKDEDNLGMTITQSTTEYILKDKENNSIKFVKSNGIGYLSEISDVSGNKITVQYNANNLISKIIDANNSEINLVYESNKITIISPSRTVYLNYLNNQLSNITNDLGTIIFTYENNIIKTITDSNDKKISYDYYEQLPYKVKKVTEYSILGDEGSSFNLVYNFSSTTITDNKNRVTTKVFNYKGQVLSTSNLKTGESINDAYGKFSKYGVYDQYKDKLMISDIPIRYVNNLLKNTSFEGTDIHFSYDSDVTLSYSDEYSVSGVKSMKLVSAISGKSVTQEIVALKGKYYTFSAYIKNSCNVKMSLSYLDNTNNLIKEESNEIYGSENFYRNDVTIFYPEDATSSIIIKITIEDSGTVYIDDIQLEEGEAANNYNILENSNFLEGMSDWTLGARSFITGEHIDPSIYFETVLLEDGISHALKIKMDPIAMTTFSKRLNIGGKAGDSHKISFWFKSQGIHSDFLLDPNNVIVLYHYIDQSNGHGADTSNQLNISEDNWQYFSYDFAAEKDYDYITLEFMQTFNANDLYITNLSLFKDIRSVDFNYDINGNVITTNNLNNKQSQFSYDKNNQLTSMCDPKGKNFTFEYDNLVTDRVLNGISGTGISNKTKYDSFGNPINVRISSETVINEISEGLYKIKLKGNNKYLKNISNLLSLKIDSGYKWYLEKVGDYYKIRHAIIDNKYLTIKNSSIVLDSYQGTSSQFELVKNNNGSYSFKSILDSNYIKNENDLLVLASFVEDDYNFQFYFEKINNKLFIENSAEYTEDGKYVKTTTDSNMNKITYDIDYETGLTKSITNAKNQKTTYSYNSKEQITSVQTGDKEVNYTYNDKNMLEKIIQGNKEYNFIYDNFLNSKSIKIGDNITLVTNNYEANNGNLISSLYGNNHTINYSYDDFDRVANIVKMNNTYSYKYGSNGDLTKIISDSGTKRYNYDVSKRLQDYIYNNFRIKYDYDSNNNVINKVYKLDNITQSISNELNDDDAVIKATSENSDFNYNYDYLGRLINKNINNVYSTNYEYITNGNRTTLLLKSLTNNTDKLSYRYDKLSNITHIYKNNNLINKYIYDEYNELISENNYCLNQTIRYKYDNSGNLLSKKVFKLNTYDLLNENKYEYNNTEWEDQLTKFNNQLITYDNIGNPLTIGNDINLTWINGRELNSYNDLNNTITYNYDKDSIRTSKTVNNVETKYYLEGNKIIFEQKENNMLYYIYNDVDNLVGFKYNNDLYYYQKNAQEDIIGILDSSYNVVAKYEYDSWGSITSVIDANGNDISSNLSHIGNINPFRYRSYYYDVETRLYYLNSRYYNAVWGRFVNADNYISTDSGPLGYNMYCYCNNNTIMNVDNEGHFIQIGFLIGIAVVGVLVAINSIYRAKKAVKEIKKVQKSKNVIESTKKIDTAVKTNTAALQKKIGNQNSIEKLGTFINSVGGGSENDLKTQETWENQAISYNGIVMEAQDVGNYNFGYIGRSLGYSTSFLLTGAGVAQVKDNALNYVTYLNCLTPFLCDDPRDSYYIMMGAIKYDSEHK